MSVDCARYEAVYILYLAQIVMPCKATYCDGVIELAHYAVECVQRNIVLRGYFRHQHYLYYV